MYSAKIVGGIATTVLGYFRTTARPGLMLCLVAI